MSHANNNPALREALAPLVKSNATELDILETFRTLRKEQTTKAVTENKALAEALRSFWRDATPSLKAEAVRYAMIPRTGEAAIAAIPNRTEFAATLCEPFKPWLDNAGIPFPTDEENEYANDILDAFYIQIVKPLLGL